MPTSYRAIYGKTSPETTARISIGCTGLKYQWLGSCWQMPIYLERMYCVIVLHVKYQKLSGNAFLLIWHVRNSERLDYLHFILNQL